MKELLARFNKVVTGRAFPDNWRLYIVLFQSLGKIAQRIIIDLHS